MGQDKPGALQDWLGSKNRARAESIASKEIASKNLDFTKLTNGAQNGDTIKASTGPKRGHYGDKTGTVEEDIGWF
jgi:hypothetical protein